MMIQMDSRGLVPAIVQDANTGQVLMMAYMNPGSIKRTIEGGQVWFYSRSRENLWRKGEASGNSLNFKEAFLDCDGDTVLLKVNPTGPVCHTGNETCFFEDMPQDPHYHWDERGPGILEELFAVIQDRKHEKPAGSYTANLLESGVARVAQKVIEEAGEAALAAATENREELPKEMADLLYHILVLLSASDITPEQIWSVLRERRA